MARLLLGKPVVQAMERDLAPRARALAQGGVVPTMAVVRVGSRADDVSYERSVVRMAGRLGVAVRPCTLPGDAGQGELVEVLRAVGADASVHGCLLLRPLPAGLDEVAACAAIDPAKDVDGVTPTSLASLFVDGDEGFPPCTPDACLRLLDHYGIAVGGRHVAVVGRSLVVGKPAAMMLLRRDATVTVCHSKTQGLAEVCRQADVVVCATGRARGMGAECFRPGQTVIDVGINVDADGALCGDVDFDAVEGVVDAITPVPAGVGSVTTMITLKHAIVAAERAAYQG